MNERDVEELDRAEVAAVVAAAALERAVIARTREAAMDATRNEAQFMQDLRRIVVSGLSTVAGKAREVMEAAKRLGQRAWRRESRALRRLRRMAPQAPEDVLRGVSIRTPDELAEEIQALAPEIIGSARGLYRLVVRRIIANPPKSEADRVRVAQVLVSEFNRRGVTAVVDKGGRRWNLVSWVEMATRTAAGNNAVVAYAESMIRAGFDVARMSVMPNCSPMCQPFQGRLLSLTGATRGEYGGESVVATLAEALAHGFRHPNCRHTLTVWVPGDVAPAPPKPDPEGYAATQRLRALERRKRQALRSESSSVDVAAKARAQGRALEVDRLIRDHVRASGVPRKPEREEPGRVL